MEYEVQSPLSVEITKKKKFILNLNNYRNAHYMVLNKAKHIYKETVLSQLDQLPRFNRISINYVLFPKSKRLCDVANICSIVDKFFCDALVETGHLEDDNYQFLDEITYSFGSVDPINPRVQIVIKET